MDLAVLNYDCYKFKPDILALACVQCSRRVKTIKPVWPDKLGALVDLQETQVEDCYQWLW